MRKSKKAILQEKQALLFSLHQKKATLGIKEDLSLHPELFHRPLRIKGLYIWDRAFTEPSLELAQITLEAEIFNETDKAKVALPDEGYLLFRLRDLQEFPYIAAVRVKKISED